MKIVDKRVLVDTQDTRVTELKILSPDIARKAQPGQFVVIMAIKEGERIPLTVVDADKDKGTIIIILQELGLTTKLLGKLEIGDSLYALVGPLGHATEIKNYGFGYVKPNHGPLACGRVILVGGGVGIAEIYPVAKALKKIGNQVTTILGARNKELLILENELKDTSDQFYITTDDGSYGRKGFTTDVLDELLKQDKYAIVYAVGPIPMMKKVAAVTRGYSVKTIVSLNPIMVDGTGMCGCCRVTVAGKTQFSCVDGPEFDGHLVDWEELVKRNRVYTEQEKHICRLAI
ncbi:MAG: sulfide/dihydroorotate dehydrogenase-like FAD/NAD-binding protein [Candidatus Omnitrophica bacterium]|nr:sulfide/dihydroorotate dehydrogenase-like FAD/NAD-binding protein [Candidatus Omnitrophota bacterium]